MIQGLPSFTTGSYATSTSVQGMSEATAVSTTASANSQSVITIERGSNIYETVWFKNYNTLELIYLRHFSFIKKV